MTEILGQQYVSTPIAARLLGLAPSTLRCHRSSGSEPVPSRKFGSAVLYAMNDIETYLARH